MHAFSINNSSVMFNSLAIKLKFINSKGPRHHFKHLDTTDIYSENLSPLPHLR